MKQNYKIYQDKISRYLLEKMKAEGFRGITLDEITKGLSISKKTVYKIYPTKEALYRSVLYFELSNVYRELLVLIQETGTKHLYWLLWVSPY